VEEDKIIMVKGRLDRKEDQIKLIAIELEDIKGPKSKGSSKFDGESVGQVSEVKKENSFDSGQTETIILSVNKTDLEKSLINDLHKIIKSNSGNSRVELHMFNSDGLSVEKIYNFPTDYSVKSGEEFFGKLREYFKDKIIWR